MANRMIEASVEEIFGLPSKEGREEIMRIATDMADGKRPSSLCDALNEIVMHGFADDTAGDCSTVGVLYDRIGRFILETTDQGFRAYFDLDTEADAEAQMNEIRADLDSK